MDADNELLNSFVSPRLRDFLGREGKHFIGGEWRAPASGETLDVLNPSSGQRIAQIAKGNDTDADRAARAADAAFRSTAWRTMGAVRRERLLLTLAELIEDSSEDLATLETLDNGMPLWMSRDLNVAGSVGALRYMAGWPTKLAGRTVDVSGPPGGTYVGFTQRTARGVVAAITPWNVPFMLAIWKLAPALAAGCTVVLKPAEAASLSALFLAELTAAAGFPPGVVNVVTGTGPELGEPLVRHPLVSKVTFTGSTTTGRRVGRIAGDLTKPVSLELGGKSPTIVFDDADLDAAVPGAAMSIFLNSGQICVAGSRLYVQRSVYDDVVAGVADFADTLNVGSGLLPDTIIGPVISSEHLARVKGYVDSAVGGGAQKLTRRVAEGPGYFVAPTVIAGAAHSAPITQEEVFGPVLSVYPFEDEEEAVAVANGTAYGLAASIWTQNLSRAYRMVDQLECGKYSVNTPPFPYPGLPEGGCKASGFGRDLGSESLDEYLHTKSVILNVG